MNISASFPMHGMDAPACIHAYIQALRNIDTCQQVCSLITCHAHASANYVQDCGGLYVPRRKQINANRLSTRHLISQTFASLKTSQCDYIHRYISIYICIYSLHIYARKYTNGYTYIFMYILYIQRLQSIDCSIYGVTFPNVVRFL